jgi:hypothetical protein
VVLEGNANWSQSTGDTLQEPVVNLLDCKGVGKLFLTVSPLGVFAVDNHLGDGYPHLVLDEIHSLAKLRALIDHEHVLNADSFEVVEAAFK